MNNARRKRNIPLRKLDEYLDNIRRDTFNIINNIVTRITK